jgi:hypothetical protein
LLLASEVIEDGPWKRAFVPTASSLPHCGWEPPELLTPPPPAKVVTTPFAKILRTTWL